MQLNLKEIVAASKDLKLLYVEDNDEVREQTLKMLENFFDNITEAVNGKDGFRKYKDANGTYDLIISDINMPHLDGIDMSKKILKIDSEQLIIITAFNESEQLARLNDIKIVNYLHKQLSLNSLLKF